MRPAAPAESDERARRAALEAEQQRGVVLEGPAAEGAELGEHLGHVAARHVLGEVEPVGAQVPDDVRRPRASRIEAPARRGEEDVVAEIATVHERDLAERSRCALGAHVLDERIAARVVAGRVRRARARPPPSTSARLSSVVTVSGFSQTTCTPRSSAASACSAWTSFGVQTWRASTCSESSSSPRSAYGRPRRRPPLASSVRPHTAATSTPISRERGAWTRGDVARADDRGARHREARNICVRTSMSSRACSGGVRHGVPRRCTRGSARARARTTPRRTWRSAPSSAVPSRSLRR